MKEWAGKGSRQPPDHPGLTGHGKQLKVPSRIQPENGIDCDMIVQRRLWKCQLAKREGAAFCIFKKFLGKARVLSKPRRWTPDCGQERMVAICTLNSVLARMKDDSRWLGSKEAASRGNSISGGWQKL